MNALKVLFDSAPAPALTFAVATKIITFGQRVTLSGTLQQNGAGFPGQPVSLWQMAVPATTFAALPAATTDTTGAFRSVVRPTGKTTYKATYPGAADGLVTVSVRHLLTLSVRKKAGKAVFRGKLAPVHAKRLVVIEVRKGSRWVTFAKVKTTKRSTFQIAKAIKPRTRYRFRARTAADRQHLAGVSRVARL